MPRRRALTYRDCFQNAPSLCLAGVLVLLGDGNFCAKLLSQQSGFGFFTAAFAGEDDEGHHAKHPASVDHAGNGSGSHGENAPHSTGTGSTHSGGAAGRA